MKNVWACSLVLGAVCALASDVVAQDQPETPPAETPEETALPDDANGLKQEVARLRREVAYLRTEVNRLRLDFAELQGKHATLTDRVNENTDNIEALSSIQDGHRVPKLLGNMNKSQGFRDEVMRTNQGQLIVTNHFRTPRVFYINGSRWRIQPGENTPIWVPLGKVTAHLERESPQSFTHWRPEPEAQRFYQMSLGIGPNRTPHGI